MVWESVSQRVRTAARCLGETHLALCSSLTPALCRETGTRHMSETRLPDTLHPCRRCIPVTRQGVRRRRGLPPSTAAAVSCQCRLLPPSHDGDPTALTTQERGVLHKRLFTWVAEMKLVQVKTAKRQGSPVQACHRKLTEGWRAAGNRAVVWIPDSGGTTSEFPKTHGKKVNLCLVKTLTGLILFCLIPEVSTFAVSSGQSQSSK